MQSGRLFPWRTTRVLLTQIYTRELSHQATRTDHPKNPTEITKTEADTPQQGAVLKLLKKLRIFDAKKYKSMARGVLEYERIVDTIDYTVFYKEFQMPDTFFSWFLVTELYVWMTMVRYQSESEYGKVVNKNLVQAMWDDVNTRVQKLGNINSAVKRRQLSELAEQFNAALIGYDEGILSQDRVLAGALWRRFFQHECNDPEQLEKLLIYVRKQIKRLDQIPSKDILLPHQIKWIDFKTMR